MRLKTFYFLTIFVFAAAAASPADQQYYERGEYDKAIETYTSQLTETGESGPLYYNLANCYLKKEDSIGKAIFFYIMARRLIPRDADLLVNLRYAKSLMKQPDMPFDEFWLLRLLRMAFGRFTAKEAFSLWNTCYFGCAIFFVSSLFLKKMRGFLRFAAILLLCLTMIMIIPLKEKITYEERTGVIVSPVVDARFEPFEDAASKFPLYEGMEVRVLKTTKEWDKIKRPDGKIGWIPVKSLWR